MKILALLIVSGGLLLTMATPANAHEYVRHEYDRGDRYYHYSGHRSDMPRWLKREKTFRKWYRHSRYKRRQTVSWARLYEIYRWERRHARRYDERYRHDHYVGDRYDYKERRRRH